MDQSANSKTPDFLDDVAEAVSHAMRIWTWWILISCIFVIVCTWFDFVHIDDVVTDHVLSKSGRIPIFLAGAFVVFPLVHLLKPAAPKATALPVVRARIVSTVIFLAGCIFLTGGILDSPYSAVLGLYVGSFVTLQQITAIVQTKYRAFAFWVLGMTLVLCLSPYLYLHLEHGSLAIIHWKEALAVGWFRIVATIFLVGVTAWHSVNLGKKLEKIANQHTAQQHAHELI